MSSPITRLKQIGSWLAPGPSTSAIVPADGEHHPFRMQTPQGLPVNITPLNPIHFLLRAASIYPEQLAMIHPEHNFKLTYAEWAHRVADLAHALLNRGLKAGDRVAVLAPNCPAVCAAGLVICPLNTRNTPDELAYVLEHSGSKLLLVDKDYAHLVKDVKVPTIIADDARPAGDAYEALLAEGRAASKGRGFADLVLPADENSGVSLCYTSGTTGRPKGCLSTLRGTYLASVANMVESQMNRSSVYLWLLPAFHACGWTFPWAITASIATQVCQRKVDNAQIWHAFDNLGVTHYCAAPTVQLGIVGDPKAHRLDRPVIANIAGAAPTATLIKRLESVNILVTHVYGLTETYGPFARKQPEWSESSLSDDEIYTRKARQGHSFLTADETLVVKVPGEDEPYSAPLHEVHWDGKEVGEIVVRGNIVMAEYYQQPEATKKAFRGGYFWTGDLAVRFPDGSISIQDRSKDIIISGGENASTLAIESALATHEDVFEVAVVARPHEKYGERAHALVILTPSSKYKNDHAGFETELKRHARERLPGFARPEWIEVTESLPKTSTGKIQKHVLRARVKAL